MSVVTWQYAADEIRAEARNRGDLDDRTVRALAAWLEQLGRGYSESNQARAARRASAASQGHKESPEKKINTSAQQRTTPTIPEQP